jgi:di/tricarboxylate transporter
LAAKQFTAGDDLLVRSDRGTLDRLMQETGLEMKPSEPPAEQDFGPEEGGRAAELVEIVIRSGSRMVGRPLSQTHLLEDFNGRILALRRNAEVLHTQLETIRLQAGDTLLVQADPDAIDDIERGPNFLVLKTEPREDFRFTQIPVAMLIMTAVVALAAASTAPIMLTALGGVVAMVFSGILRPNELYESIPWNVIFLLAGIIPLGIALEKTGGAALMGDAVAQTGEYLPAILVLWIFYIGTGLITEVISNNASVVLMIPVAVQTAEQLGANPFAFVLAVTFAASTAFLGPVGYQTNLFVYGPGGYRVSDYARIGAPLQLLLSAVTTAGIWYIWGI